MSNTKHTMNALNNPRPRKVKEVCWHCGVRKVTQYNALGMGICTHCAAKARKAER